jgi:hypothetical protein
MDFINLPIASIDYSPYRPATTETLLLEEKELRGIDTYRYERFIRVWHTERHKYTPCLKDLVLVLRPSTDSFQKDLFLEGINQFLEMFHRMAHQNETSIRIYIDNWASYSNRQIKYEQQPKLVVEIRGLPSQDSCSSA